MQLHRLRAAAALAATFALGSDLAGAQSDETDSGTNDPETVSGVERPEEKRGDAARTAGDVVLWPARQLLDTIFLATGVAAGLIEDEQVVPRVADYWSPGEGEIHYIPTAFIETGLGFNVGLRALGRSRNFASSARIGYGGRDEFLMGSRLRLSSRMPLPVVFSAEAFADIRSRSYRGRGQDPENDPRNRFAPGSSERVGKFRENRERLILGAGLRALGDFELLLSSSLTQRTTYDPRDPGADALSRVFVPGSVPGFGDTTRFLYSEGALRLDTRRSRGRPSTGVLVEGYLGTSRGVGETTDSRFVRVGGRAAGFFSIVRTSNILSPRIVLDTVDNVDDAAIPFGELAGQPDFRGFKNRFDSVSAVASLDYRWAVWRYLAARVFFDLATVSPKVRDLTVDGARWVTGFGFDVFSRSTSLGSVAVAGSPEGAQLLLSIGVSSGFGDRQHRR